MLFSRNPPPQEKEQSWVEGDAFPRTGGAPPGWLACPETVRLCGYGPTLCKGLSILFTQNLAPGALISPSMIGLGPRADFLPCSEAPGGQWPSLVGICLQAISDKTLHTVGGQQVSTYCWLSGDASRCPAPQGSEL